MTKTRGSRIAQISIDLVILIGLTLLVSDCVTPRPKVVECESPPVHEQGATLQVCTEEDRTICCIYTGPLEERTCDFIICAPDCGDWVLVNRFCDGGVTIPETPK
jgi:hypothetical protein